MGQQRHAYNKLLLSTPDGPKLLPRRLKMKARINPILAIVCLVGTFALTLFANDNKPDIVFILADDLGNKDVGFNGCTEIKTPNLDKLAAAGTVLSQFYVQPLCSPTRASLMTGRYPIRYGLQAGVIKPGDKYGLPLNEQMLPQRLHDVGYSTFAVGKWHLGEFEKAYWPTSRGFDHHYGFLFGAIDYFEHIRYGIPDWWRDGKPIKEAGYTTHLFGDEAVRIIKAQSKDKPLFLYTAFNAVHTPLQAQENYTSPYKLLKGQRRTYAGMMAALDEAVGKIVAAIDETGRRKNTLFIFSSDNGGPAPGKITDNGIFRAGKGTVYEGGVRVCAFATWEGKIKAGAKVDEPMHMVDWYPTLLKLVGDSGTQKLPLDGRDIWPTITEGKKSPHSELLVNIQGSSGAVHVGDWKLVIHTSVSPDKKKHEKIELFNLRVDPR
ncbi:MAG: arylsulfatase, partial [Verrucomicrobiales bacterium]|nr:arylsulfatase [Verrucomicrobiales bacterium]